MVDIILAGISTAAFWGILSLVPRFMRLIKLGDVLPKVPLLLRIAFFGVLFYMLELGLVEDGTFGAKITDCFVTLYDYTFLAGFCLSIIIPIALLNHYFGRGEKMKIGGTSSSFSSNLGKSSFIKPFEPSRSSSVSYRHLTTNIHHRK